MLRVGLTGGIGSGKSTIAGISVCWGFPYPYADESAKSIMNEDETSDADHPAFWPGGIQCRGRGWR